MANTETKLSKLKAAAASGDWQKALSIAASFPRLGDDKATIKRAHESFSNARFYAQLGRNPEDDIAAGIAALKRRYRLQ